MEINKDEILKELKKKLDDFKSETRKENIGRVKEIGDGAIITCGKNYQARYYYK